MIFRLYNAEKDKAAVQRIWQECGWIGKEENELKAMDIFLSSSTAWVAELHQEAECIVNTTPATIRYLKEDLPLSAVTGVTTGLIARKQGFAARLTAHALAAAQRDGALIAGLGIFDQGFYNQLGFGNGCYEHWVRFDPASLKIEYRPRVPVRLTVDDWEKVHTARLQRLRTHGNCNLLPPEITRSEMMWTEKGFGVGYLEDGALSHHMWCKSEGENGPTTILWYAYENHDQLLELFALMRQWGDQVYAVSINEPPGMQIQDLLSQPFRHRTISKQTKYENRMSAAAYWQLRMLDMEECLRHTHLPSGDITFNLNLYDPIESFIDEGIPWKSLAGEYVVTLGQECHAESGKNATLPTLIASIGAFTRLWMGILSATGLSLTDQLAGPPDLLESLDWVLRLPTPRLGWDF